MLSEIDANIDLYPIQWNWIHVKGHQDNHFDPLDRYASLKVKYNKAAKQRCDTDQQNPSHTIKHNIENEIWRL